MEHQASRAEHQGMSDEAMARLEHDVVTLPADQQALGLVEAILKEAGGITQTEPAHFLRIRLSIVQGDAERLKVLLEKGEAAS